MFHLGIRQVQSLGSVDEKIKLPIEFFIIYEAFSISLAMYRLYVGKVIIP